MLDSLSFLHSSPLSELSARVQIRTHALSFLIFIFKYLSTII